MWLYLDITMVLAALRLDGVLKCPWIVVVSPIIAYLAMILFAFVIVWVRGMIREYEMLKNEDERAGRGTDA